MTDTVQDPAPAGARPRRRGGPGRRQRLAGVLFVTPFTLLLIVFLLLPLAYAFRLSLYRSTLIQGEVFSAVDNYRKAVTDPQFTSGVRRVLIFGLIQTPAMIIIALIAALLVDGVTTRFSRVFRLAAFVPYAVPAVIGTLMWGFLYSPDTGPLHSFLHVDFLSKNVVLASLGNITTWMWAGYNMIVLYAALQGIPRDIYESAVIDGATPRQIALRIKVPLISSAIVLCTVFTIVGTLQFFTEPLLLQPLNPGTITTYYTPNLYAYNLAFSYQQYNYSAAISFLLGAVVFVGSYLFLFFNRRRSALL
jgi:multiple sugar transport system permease protein